eukprot:m.51128 g.51128  ORF g.51128 m.51128 type:complete len:357 (-) comp15205_c0_seq1:23-1093(-)
MSSVRLLAAAARKLLSTKPSPRAAGLIYDRHGDPAEVVRLQELRGRHDVSRPLSPGEVKVQMKMAPINPADINQIQGVYPILTELPAVGGNEGVGEVVETGSGTSLAPGDHVIPSGAGFGTWRTHAICNESALLKVPRDLPLHLAATITVNPCTAYRLLADFVSLRPGDCVIQNGATSGVGQAVVQIAKHMGLSTINIVRPRDSMVETVEALQALGADLVVTEDELRKPSFKDTFQKLKKPTLALNTVGGKSVHNLIRYMQRRGVVVTYGGMSKQPVSIPTGSLIFTDLTFRGFWMSKWNEEKPMEERQKMLDAVMDLMMHGHLDVAHEANSLEQFPDALTKATAGYQLRKQMISF